MEPHAGGTLVSSRGFGADWEQLQRSVSDGPRQSIEQLLRPPADAKTDEEALDQDEDAAGRASGIESFAPGGCDA